MKIYRVFFIAITTLLLSACGLSTPVKLPPESFYAISSSYIPVPKHTKTSLTILVSQVVADSGYQSSNMLYVQQAYKLRKFANHRWIAPPAEMLLPLLAQRLRAYGYFKAVVVPPFSGVTNYHLDTRLIILQQEFLQPTSLVRLVMQATLVNNVTNRVVASRRFQAMVSAPENNPYSGVLATNKASQIIAKRISKFVIQSIR